MQGNLALVFIGSVFAIAGAISIGFWVSEFEAALGSTVVISVGSIWAPIMTAVAHDRADSFNSALVVWGTVLVIGINLLHFVFSHDFVLVLITSSIYIFGSFLLVIFRYDMRGWNDHVFLQNAGS